jgi:hypothetical protein
MSEAARRSDPLGSVVALLIVLSAVPMAVLMLPNTASYVVGSATGGLGLSGAQPADLIRAGGLALPALLLAGPIAAVAARRLPAWSVLLAGIIAVLCGELAANQVTSVLLVGVVRVIEGFGAGAILPASLVLVWERPGRRALAGIWAGVLTAALIMAMPLDLITMPAANSAHWRTILQPYPLLGAVALGLTGLYGLLRLRRSTTVRIAGPRHNERTQLLLPVVPAAGFAFLAIITTYGWSPGSQLVVAGLGLAGLLGLAVVGSRDATAGSPFGYAVVMVTIGMLTMPVTSPLAGLLGAHGGPRAIPLLPFAAAGGCAVAAALISSSLRRGAGRGLILAGHGLGIAAVLLLLTAGSTTGQWTLLGPLCALGTGAGLAVGAALRHAEIGPALFGLALCFPAVLTGHLVVGPLQLAKVDAVARASGSATDALAALTSAFQIWMAAAGGIAVILAVVTVWVSRGPRSRETPRARDGGALPAR